MKRHRRGLASEDGFTLVEVAFVVLLLGVLLLIAVASFANSSGRAAEATCLSNQRTLSTAISTYRADNDGDAPASLDDLGPYARDVDKAGYCPLDGTELIIDATDQVICPNHPR